METSDNCLAVLSGFAAHFRWIHLYLYLSYGGNMSDNCLARFIRAQGPFWIDKRVPLSKLWWKRVRLLFGSFYPGFPRVFSEPVFLNKKRGKTRGKK